MMQERKRIISEESDDKVVVEGEEIHGVGEEERRPCIYVSLEIAICSSLYRGLPIIRPHQRRAE